MADKIRWGILSTGNISHKFAQCLQALENDAKIAAVGSRSLEKATKFAEEFNIGRTHGSYEELAADENVDAIYVSTPHPFHCENTILCLEHKKAVLCEKPLAMNLNQVEQMIAAAQQQNTFFMEAMWMAFFPAIAKIRELIADGAIGEVRMLTASLGFRAGWNPEGRLLNPNLGGGALLDVGVYVTAFSQLILDQEPEKIVSQPTIGETGVDEQNSMLFQYANGALAVLNSAVQTSYPHEGMICGTEGMIKLPPLFWQPDRFILCSGGKEEEFKYDRLGNGYCFEAVAVMNDLRNGKIENDIMSWEQSRRLIRTMDRVREQWNLKYPRES